MQERKEYKLRLTQLQANNLQQLLEMTTFAKDTKLEEVKEEIDEREEALKYFKCLLQRDIYDCDEQCEKCAYYNKLSSYQRAHEIAIKHIQGYKEVKEEIDRMKCDNPATDHWKSFYKGVSAIGELIEEKFDISEDK